jgi:hypothetical protein
VQSIVFVLVMLLLEHVIGCACKKPARTHRIETNDRMLTSHYNTGNGARTVFFAAKSRYFGVLEQQLAPEQIKRMQA